MEIMKLVGFALAAVILTLFVGEQHKMAGNLIRIFACTLLLILLLPQLQVIFAIINDLSTKMTLEDTYLKIIFKIIGIAYIAEFGYQLCKDAGESAIASKVQLAGKVLILVLASPIVLALIELITQLI
ncbi:MAG: stage III sporulation protein AD [Candidatus Niameybacter stercoravium]|nr:stage III sporulation protein AD [Candidatus Niameybacter stercoravium]